MDQETTDVSHNGCIEQASASTSQKPAATRKKKRTRRRTPAGIQSGDEDTEELKKRLLKRSDKDNQTKGSKGGKAETERGPVVRRRGDKTSDQQGLDRSAYDIVNPSTYDKLFARLEETHFNKAPKPEGICLDNVPWICCFCQRKPCEENLGDLFGPYYVKLAYPAFWPPFVKYPEQKRSDTSSTGIGGGAGSESDYYADLWFHGDCVCWAPGVLLRGGGMTGLDEYLPKYWSQKCTRCHEVGANMVCSVKGCNQRFHFPCAVRSECGLKESSYAMHCAMHKKSLEKK